MTSAAFLLPELRADKARVTSGCPSLSPIERVTRDYRVRQRCKAQAAYNDGARKQEQAVAPDGNRPRTLLEAQLGKPMMGTDFQKRVAFLCPSLFFEQSLAFPDRMLIYRRDPERPEGKHLVCAFQRGWSPEFSVRDSSTGGEMVRG